MPHSFIYQPDKSGFSLQDTFVKFAGLHDLERVDIVVAWAKRTGIEALLGSVQSMRSSGAFIRAVIGINQGGTSRQALSDALDLFDEAWIFHVPGRTFHPKVFMAKAPKEAMVLVGSHNLTAGGAVNNFEAGVLSHLDLDVHADQIFYREVIGFVERLCNDTKVCRQLDDDLLSALIASSAYPLDDEDIRLPSPLREPMEDRTSAEEIERTTRLFSSSSKDLRWFRSGHKRTRSETRQEEAEKVSGFREDVHAGKPTDNRIIHRWFKKLGAIDAQQPGSGHRSNTMTLVQGGHDIDRTVYWVFASKLGPG